MKTTGNILFDDLGRLRSGWRAASFLFVCAIAIGAIDAVVQIALVRAGLQAALAPMTFLALGGLLSTVPALLLGWLCGRLFESLPFRAIGAAFTRGWLRNLIAGLLVGAATLCLAVSIGFVGGGLSFQPDAVAGFSIVRSLAVSFVVFAAAAAFEESLFRGYVLQTFARSGLAWPAILVTALFFGLVHLGNPDVGIISTANTMLAGVWFGVAYLKTRDLWFVWGLHLMWNWMQGAFFGIQVSGLKVASTPLLIEIDRGPGWLTGQSYGLEGGIAAAIAIILSTIAIHYLPTLRPDPEMLALTSPLAAPTVSKEA